jgi:RNA polymerase sigma-70 factor (sigma-E family)
MASLAEDFDEYVRTRTPALLRSAFLLTGDQHLAEDLVQSALIRTHRAWRRLRGAEDGHPDAYTRKVMYHLQVARWRRRRVPESLGGPVPEPRGQRPDEAAGVIARLSVREALLRLTPRQRAVLVLRYFEDRTELESAELLGVSIGTVKSQTAKALARLRSLAPDLVETADLTGRTT